MFVIKEKELGLAQGIVPSLETVFRSINEPKISAVDQPAEPTQAYIVMNRSGEEEMDLRVVLFLKNSKNRVVYEWDGGNFSEGIREELESEALDFVENMGFMMDNLNVEEMDSGEKAKLADGLPIFEEGIEDLSDLAELADEDLEEIEDLKELEEFAELAERGADDAGEDLLDLEKELELPAEVSDVLEAKGDQASSETKEARGEQTSFGNEEVSQSMIDASQEALDLLEMEFSRDDEDLDAELESAVSSIQQQSGAPQAEESNELETNAMDFQNLETGTIPSPRTAEQDFPGEALQNVAGSGGNKDLLIRLMASF